MFKVLLNNGWTIRPIECFRGTVDHDQDNFLVFLLVTIGVGVAVMEPVPLLNLCPTEIVGTMVHLRDVRDAFVGESDAQSTNPEQKAEQKKCATGSDEKIVRREIGNEACQ